MAVLGLAAASRWRARRCRSSSAACASPAPSPALVLAVVLLGPAPAVAGRRRQARCCRCTRAALAAALRALEPLHARRLPARRRPAGRAASTPDARVRTSPSRRWSSASTWSTNLVNFLLIWGYLVVADGQTWRAGFVDVYVPRPPRRARDAPAASSASPARPPRTGPGATVLVAVVALLFQCMLRTALQAAERGEELEERNQPARGAAGRPDLHDDEDADAARPHDRAPLGGGRPLRPRDGRASSGSREREQELFHTAGLFHDIGKFIFPDSILLGGHAAHRRASTRSSSAIPRSAPS